MTTFFISDTHFSHGKIIKLANRPYASIDEMDADMIYRWNQEVSNSDHVWFLGDFSYKSDNPRKYFDQLNGRKSLVVGNHDGNETRSLPWLRIEHTVIEQIGGQWFHLHHYPLREWQGFYKGTIHLHGHTHGKIPDVPGSIDVGVERMNYAPIDLYSVIKREAGWKERKDVKLA